MMPIILRNHREVFLILGVISTLVFVYGIPYSYQHSQIEDIMIMLESMMNCSELESSLNDLSKDSWMWQRNIEHIKQRMTQLNC